LRPRAAQTYCQRQVWRLGVEHDFVGQVKLLFLFQDAQGLSG